ncbi:geranylgeranylglycerol-phosphate geranylgeranyltransferase [Flaviramulus sp. BrNp1-15]|uniref:geranylgeranylglycerol-phosphate geranylgeranyltransferase n=1 Tax=Flaviramulus sp. BrNp1-15 TaxID=2916754 RepID=UPI001EE94266|nr:geranylgeranylglycerol-phosphate geranylgeranyltransferase [Flaviramulus sp. BrNp1-15]ULC60735.1 geranylgeranylglycerol-phosphate geranylgeranyltransferase [Flaviramulus sp. BrNp1-15]
MFDFLNLIRWKNLLMLVLVQLLIKYALLEPFGVQTSLNSLEITLLILATICIAAAGNIINDINDIETDFINKPDKIIVGESISEKVAYNLFIILNVAGVGIGFYLSQAIGRSGFFSIFVIISVLLYVYATYLKRTLLIGNIIISALVALSIIIVGIFEILPATSASNQQTQFVFFKVILDYALFAFSINLLREIVKDIEDIDGDYKAEMNTLPIAIGRERAKNVISILNFFPLIAIVLYTISNLYKQPVAVGYFLLFIIGPLLYTCIKTFSATNKKDFHHLSNMYKIIMLFGMLSLLLYKFVILK